MSLSCANSGNPYSVFTVSQYLYRNPSGAKDGHKAFKAVSEAYEVSVLAQHHKSQKLIRTLIICHVLGHQVLKDPAKRAAYDAVKDSFPSTGSATYTYTQTSYTQYKPSWTAEQDNFDEFFAKWWAKREKE